MPDAALLLGPSVGGIGTHVRSLAAGLIGQGLEVVVAGPAATEEHFDFSGTGAEFRPVDLKSVRGALKDADIVHAHGLRAGFSAAINKKQPLVVTLHNAPRGGLLVKASERIVMRRADLIFGASSDLVDRARKLGAKDPRLCPIAAPHLKASRTREEVRRELAINDDQPLILAVGRLAAQKDYPTLFEAVSLLHAGPQVIIAGEGLDQAALQRQIDEDCLPVRLLGHRGDVGDLLAAADVFVLPSRWEARALVVQEAMRAGVPVVATAVGGIPELVGGAAELVPPGEPRALAGALTRLLDGGPRRAELIALGNQQVTTWSSEADTIGLVLAGYKEVASS